MQFPHDAAGDDLDFYRAVLGPKNQDRYLKKFQHFDTHGTAAPSWHWGALFFTSFWLMYRRQWLHLVLYYFVPFALVIAATLAGTLLGVSKEVVGWSSILYWAAIFILPALYADAVYYRHCKAHIAAARASGNSRDWQLGLLTGKGGTNRLLLIIGVLWLVAALGIVMAVAVPAYQTYQGKAQLAGAWQVARGAAGAVETHYHRTGRMPDSLAEAGFTRSLPEPIASMTVDNGVVVVQTYGQPGKLRTLRLTPTPTKEGVFSWRCSSPDVEATMLPPNCRR